MMIVLGEYLADRSSHLGLNDLCEWLLVLPRHGLSVPWERILRHTRVTSDALA